MSLTGINSIVRFGIEIVDGLSIFYRESGDDSKQTIVLLHGFPDSSQQFREVLSKLGDEFHVIAPDYPGFGDSSCFCAIEQDYTFEKISVILEKFLRQKKLENYVLMVHDYGGPIGFRIATSDPKKIAGFVVMNANAYEEGFDEQLWDPIFEYWDDRSDKIGKGIAARLFSEEGLRWIYTHGTRNPKAIDPDNWNRAVVKFKCRGQCKAQLDLIYDFQNNARLYFMWQGYLRRFQPPMLIVWGKNDALYLETGAEGYIRDSKNIDYHILDTGHFPLEEESEFIIEKMRNFLRAIS